MCSVWYGTVWYGMVRYDMVRYGMVWYGTVWYDTRAPTIDRQQASKAGGTADQILREKYNIVTDYQASQRSAEQLGYFFFLSFLLFSFL